MRAAASRETSSDAFALTVGRTVIALVAALGLTGSAAGASGVYDQRSLPPGFCPPSDPKGADRFLRLHRQMLRAGTAGWCTQGQRRTVTAQAWDEYVTHSTHTARSRRAALPSANRNLPDKVVALSDHLDRALGIRTRRTR